MLRFVSRRFDHPTRRACLSRRNLSLNKSNKAWCLSYLGTEMFEENQLMCAQEMGRAYYHVITMIRRTHVWSTIPNFLLVFLFDHFSQNKKEKIIIIDNSCEKWSLSLLLSKKLSWSVLIEVLEGSISLAFYSFISYLCDVKLTLGWKVLLRK